MSGTSLDGLDIAYCTFTENIAGWEYKIDAADCIPYTDSWKNALQHAPSLSGYDLILLHKNYGFYLADCINNFNRKYNLQPQLIASHGHTIYHDPQKYLSLQIGDGAALFSRTSIPVVCDFRSVDVCLGGQGAPLVPIGDKLLFSNYDFCLNLGGIANISFENNEGKRIAYDISPCNLLLNKLANMEGLEYDKNGELAQKGITDQNLLALLDNWEYYKNPAPKSLDKDQLMNDLWPLISEAEISVSDKLATVTFHIAKQISKAINAQIPYRQSEKNASKLLATGGGAFNKHLIQSIQHQTDVKIIVPDANLVNYKEALIFAFLGLLRLRNKNNSLATVTGAKTDSIGGALYGDFSVFV
ncbi:MAG: anhydro-N-acetylmuramic acid kinase [Sphingobacteriales bacterium]|nr:MAG: anhydro-N-acetylmuramic acid kinase [Sphingobacteriales bacterium]